MVRGARRAERMTAPELLVMAAGVGSRYGGLKQVDPLGPGGEFVMDYAIYDAWREGVERVVFVIRHDMAADFHAQRGARYAARLRVDYVTQELADLPAGMTPPPGRTKPWGTGHAVYAARRAIAAPFLCINADDFYGREGIAALADFLRQPAPPGPDRHAMVAFRLRNTLSEHGSVARGVCQVSPGGDLIGVREHPAIQRRGGGIHEKVGDGSVRTFSGDERVSLNLWGFRPGLFPELEPRFAEFLRRHHHDAKAEFQLPKVVDELIHERRATVRVLDTDSVWSGVTYRDDRAAVQERLRDLAAAGTYPSPLWS
jgi:dTDP-glucose pyrophosphorylase